MVNVPFSTFQSIPPLVPEVAGFSNSGTSVVVAPSPLSATTAGIALSSKSSESFKPFCSDWSPRSSEFCCVTCPEPAVVLSGFSPSAASTAVGKSENTMQRHKSRDIIRFFNLRSSKFIKYLYEAHQWQAVFYSPYTRRQQSRQSCPLPST